MDIFIDFGGFYNTWHDDICERAVAWQIGAIDEQGEIDGDKLFNFDQWGEIHSQYAEKWLDMLNSELGLNIKYCGLVSPRFYNYSTDVIAANITRGDCLSIVRYIRENDLKADFTRALKDRGTSRDGYAAWYTPSEFYLSENRDHFIRLALEVIIEHLNADYPFILEDFYPDISEAAA